MKRLAVLLLPAFGAVLAQAQTAEPDKATLQQLLTEVKRLRQAVEQSLTLSPRIQLLTQRAQFQQQKVSRVSQQLDDVHQRLVLLTAQQTQASERLAKVEQELQSETDNARRAQLEDLRNGLKAEAAAINPDQLRARESELSSSLAAEQAVLDEFNGKLDALERQLEAPPSRN